VQKITKKKVEQNSVYKKYSLGVTADYSSPDGLLLPVGGPLNCPQWSDHCPAAWWMSLEAQASMRNSCVSSTVGPDPIKSSSNLCTPLRARHGVPFYGSGFEASSQAILATWRPADYQLCRS